MKKIIYTQEWIAMHPYTRIDDVDIYYTNLANKIYHALDESCFLHQFGDIQDAKCLALCIAGYFEDVISGTCIWKTFTEECKDRYDTYLPFYLKGTIVEKGIVHENDGTCPAYDPDEINISDIKFLLWHHYQQSVYGREIIPPLFSTVEVAAKMIYDVLDAEYETAPENERLYEFLCTQPIGEDDFYAFRNVMEWFHYGCYFNVGNRKRFVMAMQWLANTGNYNGINAYGMKIEQMMESRDNLLALSSAEWLAKISKHHPDRKLWTETEYRNNRAFTVEREDDRFYYAKDLYSKDIIKVNKKSAANEDFSPLIDGAKVVFTNMVRFGDAWWQNGTMRVVDNDKTTKKFISEERDRLNHKQQLKDYQLLKDSGYGARFIFAESLGQAKEFVESIGYKRLDEVKFPPKCEKGVIIYGSPYTGISIAINIAPCIKCDINPFYDAERAEAQCFDIICGRGNAFPYEIVCQLIAGGMLPDANMFTSKYTKEIGKRITQENLQFLADYYLRGRMDKDLSPVELW